MDTSVLIWIIVAIVVVAVIIGVVVFLRKRGTSRADANRKKAAEIRAKAQETDLAAREREAEAARVQAEAKRAEADAQAAKVRAERLSQEGAERQNEANGVRAKVDEHLQKADKVDPDVNTDHGKHRR